MGCCGQTLGGLPTLTQREIDDGVRLYVEYQGGQIVRVKGSVTGKTYVFSGASRISKVDPRDGPGILPDRRFRLRGIGPEKDGD